MSARDNLNAQQLAMFMPAHELIEGVEPHFGDMLQYTNAEEDRAIEALAYEHHEARGRPKNAYGHTLPSVTDYDHAYDTVINDPYLSQEFSDNARLNFWDRKLEEAHDTGLYQDIEDEGIRNPVLVVHSQSESRPMFGNGQHRLAAAHDLDPHMEVPVMHMATSIADQRVRDNQGGRGYGMKPYEGLVRDLPRTPILDPEISFDTRKNKS